jgi:hypothetical protein
VILAVEKGILEISKYYFYIFITMLLFMFEPWVPIMEAKEKFEMNL